MNKLLYKVATGISTAALVASSFAPLVSAEVTVEVSGNGADSENEAEVEIANQTLVEQNNSANITNEINVNANTGDNDANRNTGGSVDVSTGDASADVNVLNAANHNVAEINGCCPGDIEVKISGNGADSENEAEVEVENETWVEQNNWASVKNDVDVDLNTGYNDANRNTGGDVSISTGNAKGYVTVTNLLNKNIASIGNGLNGGGSLAVWISGNGADSENEAEVEVATLNGILQNNAARIKNDVDVDANTGYNDANRNTGGDVEIDTGNAKADVEITNMANFNSADIDSCGCILDATIKIKDNGADSENEAEVELASIKYVTQNNDFSCGSRHRGGDSSPQGEGRRGHRPCNDVDVDLNTGDNDTNRNTHHDGDPSVTTGDALADVVVETVVNHNQVGDADFDIDFPEFNFDGNSSASILLLLLALLS